MLLREGDGISDRLALHAGIIEEVHILLTILLDLYALIRADEVIPVLLLKKELFSQLTHFFSTSVNSFWQAAENSSHVPLFFKIWSQRS